MLYNITYIEILAQKRDERRYIVADILYFTTIKLLLLEKDLQDGRGVRRGDQLPPHKYIKNTSTCGTTPTEHLLNAGRRPQTSQKARHSPRTWVGEKEKNNRDKRIGTGPAPLGGSCEGGKVSTH